MNVCLSIIVLLCLKQQHVDSEDGVISINLKTLIKAEIILVAVLSVGRAIIQMCYIALMTNHYCNRKVGAKPLDKTII